MRIAFFLAFALATASTQAATPPDEALDAAWLSASSLSVDVDMAGKSAVYRYRFDIDDKGEMQIDAAYEVDHRPVHGNMLLVGDMLAVKALPLKPGQEIDTIDAAVLTYQMCARLLARGAAAAPDQIAKPVAADVREARQNLEVATASADMTLPAPWTLRGRIEPTQERALRFDLDIGVAAAQGTQHMRYRGEWQRVEPRKSLPDAMSLAGWNVFRLTPVKQESNASSDYDISATAMRAGVATVGELRKVATKAKPDPERDQSSSPDDPQRE